MTTQDTITTSDGRTMPLDGLEQVARAATPGPWMWFNGCSWWRLGTVYIHEGEQHEKKHDAVLCPTKDRRDGHPDLIVSQENREYLEQADPLVCLALVAEVRRLRETLTELFTLLARAEQALLPLATAAQGAGVCVGCVTATELETARKVREEILAAIETQRATT